MSARHTPAVVNHSLTTQHTPSDRVWAFVDGFCAALAFVMLALMLWPVARSYAHAAAVWILS